jgi:hypothetical protein
MCVVLRVCSPQVMGCEGVSCDRYLIDVQILKLNISAAGEHGSSFSARRPETFMQGDIRQQDDGFQPKLLPWV